MLVDPIFVSFLLSRFHDKNYLQTTEFVRQNNATYNPTHCVDVKRYFQDTGETSLQGLYLQKFDALVAKNHR